ncbi:MAG: hypothetical protein ACREX6_05335 [Casimicrobiaceae bacterium]
MATLASAAILATVVAYWAWQILGPVPVRIAPRAPADPVATLIASGMFGGAPGTGVAGDTTPTLLPGAVRLLGIIAETGGNGYALFRVGSTPKLVVVGAAITGTTILVSVARDSVTVREGGREHSLALWPPVSSAATLRTAGETRQTRSGPAVVRTASAHDAACAPPAGFTGPVIRLNSELLGGLRDQPAVWGTLLASSAEGLVVRNSGGYAAMLGLAAGDRIEQANGIALHSPEDVASVVLRPLTENQGVRLRGTHQGARREIWIACATCAG